MIAWKPTDEQIEALAIEFFTSNRPTDVLDSPAFQSIIRAAQAEAWLQGFDVGNSYTPGWGPDPLWLNPYGSES